MRSSEQSGNALKELLPERPQYYFVDFNDLLRRKGIDPAVFTRHPHLTEDSPLSNHVAFLFDNILSLPYASVCKGDFTKTNGIARLLHGVQHAVRTAKLVMVFANLSRRHGDAQAQNLTEKEVKRMQLMALFHDCAREDDAKDETDYESAIILYHYLTKVVGMDAVDAKFYAETVANKEEIEELARFTLWLDENDQYRGYIQTLMHSAVLSRRTAAMECLYDSDCLDVMRARSRYRGKQLNFFKNIVDVTKTKLSLEELAHLICEWRSILDFQGDTHKRMDIAKKSYYEDNLAWERFDDSLAMDIHPIVWSLSSTLLSMDELLALNFIDISPYDPAQGMTEKNLRAAMREGRVYARSVCSPSAYKVSHPDETMAAFELRKLFRQQGIPANARVGASTNKFGNQVRSVSMMEKGAGSYGRAGFLFLDPRKSTIKLVASTNMRTGFGKKAEFLSMFAKQPQPSLEEIEKQLQVLLLDLKLGGHGESVVNANAPYAAHPEVVCDMESVNAIYYTNDHTLYRQQVCRPFQENNRLAPLIEAIYLRKLYRQFYEAGLAVTINMLGEEAGRKQFTARFGVSPDLPIFFVSGMHHVVHEIPKEELTDEYIILYWKWLIRDYLSKTSSCLMTECLLDMDLDQLKIEAVSGNEASKRIARMGVADECYDDLLKSRLNREIELMIFNYITDTEIEYCSMALDGLLSTKDEKVKIAFLSAIKNGHNNIVYQLLGKDRSLCEAEYSELYPLHIAACSYQSQMVRVLLEHFAHPDIAGSKGMRPLHCAVSREDEESVRELLAKNANVNVADQDGITPLMIAAAKDNTRLMSLLLTAKANVNAVTLKNESALTFAIRNKMMNAVNLLLGCKLDIQSSAVLGESVIAAVETDAIDIIDSLVVKGASLEAVLQYAVNVNHYDTCFVLLAMRASVAGVILNERTMPDITLLIDQTRRALFKPN